MDVLPQGSSITAYDVASIHHKRAVCVEMEGHGYKSLAPPTEVLTVVCMEPLI